MRSIVLCLCVLIGTAGGDLSQAQAPGSPKGSADNLSIAPIDVSVLSTPVLFKAGGRWNLAYELRVASLEDVGDVTITSIQELNPAGKTLVEYSGETLKASIDPDAAIGLKLGPRTFTTVFMWLSASSRDEIPPALSHRVTLKDSDETDTLTTETLPVAVEENPVMVIGPPIQGDDWVAFNGPSNSSVHRRAILPLQGRSFISQRFAIDWVQVYPDGELFREDKLQNKNYRAYGQPVLAVADGTVTELKDGIPENTPSPTERAVEMTPDSMAGNHIIEKIGDGAYATYAHMQPGSLRVKLGGHVKKGQTLGLVGNSGNSTGPHLHFQICDANSVFACQGLPYAFSSFESVGEWKPEGQPVKHTLEIPIEGEVVNFDSGDHKTSAAASLKPHQ